LTYPYRQMGRCALCNRWRQVKWCKLHKADECSRCIGSKNHRWKMTVGLRKEISDSLLLQQDEDLASLTAESLAEFRKLGGAQAGWFFDALDSVSDRLDYTVEIAPGAQRDLERLDNPPIRSDLTVAITMLASGPDAVRGARRIGSDASTYRIMVSGFHLTYAVYEEKRLLVVARVVAASR
jgi:mRNA-degrading endonuclease RelE of RelBE toxin-antitoxin system